jgi:hypothetical protein
MSLHNFYIPVMGTGFTIDTPLAVAKYGISSVISLLDDVLIEQMRKFWCEQSHQPYEPIPSSDRDHRAKRITAYLNLLEQQVTQQITKLKTAAFEVASDIYAFFEMLANEHPLKHLYQKMLAENDPDLKQQLQNQLRQSIYPGNIDVNIMTKCDCKHLINGEPLPYNFCDAASALRGFANSTLNSFIVLSAGFNPNLYGYMANFDDFFPNKNNILKKKICLKVSDYRSAAIQGKYLAKHGLWVSEFRIESPLNCGGHAFINDGQLMGPILEEFKQRKNELIETLYNLYCQTLKSKQRFYPDLPPKVRLTAQGGIGTHEEHDFLINYYELDGAGWGTPFLLVPEATNVDEKHLKKLINAKYDDVFLSSSSPLGVPFWNLRNSASEEERILHIKQGTPGSSCTRGYARLNQEFTTIPICTASREYQKNKLQELEAKNLPANDYEMRKTEILSKSCICHDLSGGVMLKRNIDSRATTAICPGPNILNFKQVMTLKTMVDHIYGRCSVLANKERLHMFISELQLQLNYLLNEIKQASLGLPIRPRQKILEAKTNLLEGIAYYRNRAKEIFKEQQEKYTAMLQTIQKDLENIFTS